MEKSNHNIILFFEKILKTIPIPEKYQNDNKEFLIIAFILCILSYLVFNSFFLFVAIAISLGVFVPVGMISKEQYLMSKNCEDNIAYCVVNRFPLMKKYSVKTNNKIYLLISIFLFISSMVISNFLPVSVLAFLSGYFFNIGLPNHEKVKMIEHHE